MVSAAEYFIYSAVCRKMKGICMNKKCNILSVLICISLCFITSGCGWNTSFLGKAVAEIEHMVSNEATDDAAKSAELKEQYAVKQAETVKKDVLMQANEVLQSKNAIYKLAAVSKFDENGFFGLDISKGITFVVYDKKDDMIARVDYDKALLRPRDNKYETMDKMAPIIFKMHIENDDKNGEDKILGVWNGNVHEVPIYALFEVDNNNNIIPGMLYSAQGENPSHYHGVLKEQKNVNLANIVLTHADSLNEDIIKRGISLP